MRRCGVVAAVLLALAGPAGHAQERAAPSARVVEAITLDADRFDGAFGGISGIAHDVRGNRWLLLSDDRSDHAPSGFYTARIERGAQGWRVRGSGRVPLRDARGAVFPKAGTGREAADPEAIRLIPDGRRMIWSSEGDAKDGFGPAVRVANFRGRERSRIALPGNLRFDPQGARGSRDNGTIEGMDYTPDGALWLSMEAPLIEDGLPAAEGRTALVRFTRLGKGGPAEQYAYRLDAAPPSPHGKGADNGVTEILAIDDRRMLVLERSGAPDGMGNFLFHCRLYLADFSAATDVAGIASLKDAATVPATKRLLIDFDTLPNNPGNLEAMAWWPFARGRRDQLILLNDNNFVPGEPTRLLLLTLPEDLVRPAR